MLAFSNRFHGHGSLRYVYKNGQSVRSRFVTLKFTKNPRRKSPRIAVVISKKVLKSAVGRNRIRRRVYEIVRQEIPQLAPKHDIVLLIFSRELRDCPYDDLRETVQHLFLEAGLYKNQ